MSDLQVAILIMIQKMSENCCQSYKLHNAMASKFLKCSLQTLMLTIFKIPEIALTVKTLSCVHGIQSMVSVWNIVESVAMTHHRMRSMSVRTPTLPLQDENDHEVPPQTATSIVHSYLDLGL